MTKHGRANSSKTNVLEETSQPLSKVKRVELLEEHSREGVRRVILNKERVNLPGPLSFGTRGTGGGTDVFLKDVEEVEDCRHSRGNAGERDDG